METNSDFEIMYGTARLLIEKHGAVAPIHAAREADALLEDGDLAGQAVWLRINDAVKALLRSTPSFHRH